MIRFENAGVFKREKVWLEILDNSPASEFYMPTFRNTLSHLHRRIGMKDD